MVNSKRSANHLNNRKIKEKYETPVKHSQLNKALHHMSDLAKQKKVPMVSSSRFLPMNKTTIAVHDQSQHQHFQNDLKGEKNLNHYRKKSASHHFPKSNKKMVMGESNS